jgi:diguanylate cyclase (GGDEF)-like protein
VGLGNPLSWRMADRCFAIALILTFANVVVLVSTLSGGWPFLPYPARLGPDLPWTECVSIGLWAALAGACKVAKNAGVALAAVTVFLYAVTLAGFTLAVGPFAAPGWIAYLGGAVVGYVLFPRWLALGGIVLYQILVIAGAYALGAGHVPTQFGPAYVFAGLDPHTVTRDAAASLALFALTFSVIAFIVDRWRAREAGYERLASTDALTGLTNRRRFMEVAAQELARARRYGSSLALIVIDLDHFKRINDQHGHLVGDQALVHAARVLASSVRDVDVIARHGGEEFAVLLPMTDAKGAAEVAERCIRRLDDSPLILDGVGPIRVTASMGVAACEGPFCKDVDGLLKVADAALYQAKEAGRDRVIVSGS